MRTNNIVQTAIPVDEALVQERSVSVKVLSIGTKQVTQSLYKQLQEQDVIEDETGKLNGIPWGWVNLHTDCKESPHRHVVWERNGELKRACVYLSLRENCYYRDLERELYKLARVYIGLISIAGKTLNQTGDTVYLTVKGHKIAIDISGNIRQLWDYPQEIRQLKTDLAELLESDENTIPEKYKGYSSRQYAIKHIQLQIDHAPNRINSFNSMIEQMIHHTLDSLYGRNVDYSKYISYEQIYQKMEKLADEITEIQENWAESFKAIQDAGQLFIAVSGVWK